MAASLSIPDTHSLLAILESSEVKSPKEIAEPEKIEDSCISPMIKPICQAPEIVAAILDDEFSKYITLFELVVESRC